MKLRRFLRPDAIRLDLHTPAVPAGVLPEDFDPDGKRNINRVREGVARELTELFEATGAVSNPTKLFKELCDREKKAPTGVGNGIALPHLRTLQAKSFAFSLTVTTPTRSAASVDSSRLSLTPRPGRSAARRRRRSRAAAPA